MTHTCHWPGCKKAVPPYLWGCRPHWYSLPQDLRHRLKAVYVTGQEITKTPSEEYLKVAMEIKAWIKARQEAFAECGGHHPNSAAGLSFKNKHQDDY